MLSSQVLEAETAQGTLGNGVYLGGWGKYQFSEGHPEQSSQGKRLPCLRPIRSQVLSMQTPRPHEWPSLSGQSRENQADPHVAQSAVSRPRSQMVLKTQVKKEAGTDLKCT